VRSEIGFVNCQLVLLVSCRMEGMEWGIYDKYFLCGLSYW
jgi:hypothetical protein